VRRGERAHPDPDCRDMAVEQQQLFADLWIYKTPAAAAAAAAAAVGSPYRIRRSEISLCAPITPSPFEIL